MRRFLTETMGVARSRVTDLLSAGWSTTQLRHACHVAQQNYQRNLGGYLCRCLESPTPIFWREAAEAWEDERERLRKEVAKALRTLKVGYEWRSFVTKEVLPNEVAYLYDLESFLDDVAASAMIDGKPFDPPTLCDSMLSMLQGLERGRADNAVIGGVTDYDEASSVARLLTNYGLPLTKAFMDIIDPSANSEALMDELSPEERAKTLASSVARAPYPEFIDPQWADRLGVETPVGNPDRTADYLWLDSSSDEAVSLRQNLTAQQRQRDRAEREAAQKAEAERQQREEEERLRQLRSKPRYEALPDERGTLCEEIGSVLNEKGVTGVLLTYGFSIGFEFLEKLLGRHGLNRTDVEQLIIRKLNALHKKDRRDLVEEMIAATVARAPYPVWFTQQWNSWWRMVMQSQADRWHLKPPTYGSQEMADYTSLKDLTNPHKANQPDEPHREVGTPRAS